MSSPKKRRDMPARIVTWLCVAVIVSYVGSTIGTVIFKMVRINKNAPIAKQVAEEAQVAFPTATFSGSTGYQENRIRITIVTGFETLDLEELKNWLRAKRAEKKFSAKITLMYPKDYQDVPIDP